MTPKGFVVKPRDSDYVMGVSSPIEFRAVTNGDWTSHYQFFEKQKYTFDTNGCVLFSVEEDFDAQMDVLLATAPIWIVNQLTTMGYMQTGRDGQLHFHSSPRFLQILTGNGFNGNSIPEAWDAARKYGMLPWTDLPFDETVSQQDYINPQAITPAMYEKAMKFLALIGGKDSIQYHWVINNAPKNLTLMQSAQLHAPLCIGIAVNESGYNQQVPSDPPDSQAPGHCMATTQVVSPAVVSLDHYEPFIKTLDSKYPIHFVSQGIVTINPPIAPPPIEPTQHNVDILKAIVALYQKILSLLPKGRSFSSETMNPTFYSILKSKTFYTLLVGFAYNAWQLFSPSVSPQVSAVVDAIFIMLANYFHVKGVNNAAVSSATLGRAVSGQA